MTKSFGLIALILFVLGVTLVLAFQGNLHNEDYPNGTVRSQLEK